jgi:MFS family permease
MTAYRRGDSLLPRIQLPTASARLVVGRTFAAFRNRNYRWFWIGRLSGTGGFQIRNVVRGWLVYNLTGSALALSWVGAGWSVATLVFSMMGGVVSDRFRKRHLLLGGQALSSAVLFGVTLLVASGMIQVWHLAVSSLLLGGIFAFIMPARQALLSEMLSRRVLLNAMAMSAVGMALMGMMSSTASGWLIERYGPTVVYVCVTALYAASIGAYSRVAGTGAGSQRSFSLRSDLIEGARYALRQPAVLALMGLELSRVIFYMPYRTFLPVFASDVFEVGAVGLGLLSGVASAGGLLGSLAVAALGDIQWKGPLLLITGGVGGLGLILFALAPSFHLALAFLLVVNAAGNAYMVIRSTLLQTMTDRRMRGRVVAFNRLVWGLMPLGTLPAGAMADAFGAPLTVTVQGVMVVLAFGLVALLQPRLRQLQ